MNYTALIENRKSVRAFRSTPVPADTLAALRGFYEKDCRRLIPDIPTELCILGTEARAALEGTAGYEEFLIGAPQYLVLLSGDCPHAAENAGYMMEDLILKAGELGLDSCWITFSDGEKIKKALGLASGLNVAAIAAIGPGEKTAKRMRLNIFSMSNVDIKARRQYYAHKKDIEELAFLEQPGNTRGLEEAMGFYDDMLWQALYAASQAPSYLNRQPYAFLLKDHGVTLLRLPDPYTDDVSMGLDLGIVMLHFAAVASQWIGDVRWTPADGNPLPDGSVPAAYFPL